MAWRDGEVWLDADLLWFREQRQGALGVPSLALAGTAARFDPPQVRPRRNGARSVPPPAAGGKGGAQTSSCDAHRARRRARPRLGHDAPDRRAAQRRRTGRPTRRRSAEPDLPARGLHVPSPRAAGRAEACRGSGAGDPARRVESRDVDRPSVRGQSGRRDAAARRGARLGHLEPRDGQQPEPARPALGSRAHDPCDSLRAGRLSRRAPRRTAGRRR